MKSISCAVSLKFLIFSLFPISNLGYLQCDPMAAAARSSRLFGSQIENLLEIRNVKGLQNGLKIRKVPNTDLAVSEICLGTMTYGEQIGKDDAMEQLDLATSLYGINFMDTAETYPAPSSPSTSGNSERIIGQWMKSRKVNRRDVVISTKICGFSDEITWCRQSGLGTRVNREQVVEAVDAQLRRLGTDYIDILHIHWPDRYVPLFGAPEYLYENERDAAEVTPIRAQLEIMDELIRAGKVRHFALSNETPFGLANFVATAELLSLPRPCMVQNAYNLLVRNDFETGMKEACSYGNVGLMAYSPLAGGALSGKYLDPSVDRNARMRKQVGFMHRYIAAPAAAATQAYSDLAASLALPLAPLALAFVYSRPFVTSTVIGATSAQQLHENVLALNLPISDVVAGEINSIYRQHLDPTRGMFEVIDLNVDYVDAATLPWGAKDTDMDPELDRLLFGKQSKAAGASK